MHTSEAAKAPAKATCSKAMKAMEKDFCYVCSLFLHYNYLMLFKFGCKGR